jgi:CheY-like chemotaxis protein
MQNPKKDILANTRLQAASGPEAESVLSNSRMKAALDRLAPGLTKKKPVPVLLLVDDDDHDSFFFQNAVKAAGISMRVIRIRDGQEAIDYFRGKGRFADRKQFPIPQMTLLDIKMPRRNGFEVLKFLRRSARFEKAIVIALTSSSDEKDIQQAHLLRIDAYLVKPAKASALIEIALQLEKFWLETVLKLGLS